jgi:transposase
VGIPTSSTAAVPCRSCANLRVRNAALLRQVRVLRGKLQKEQALRVAAERRVMELEDRLRVNATNSSLPPSANPKGAPKPAGKPPTGRKRGAQAGHRGHGRKLVSVDRVDEVVMHRPAACGRCQSSLEGVPGDVAGRHQVAELPARAVRVTEHQSVACRCPACGAVSRGAIPAAVRASATGPRLTGAIGLLSGFAHGSRRAVRLVVEQVLGCPIALGSVNARERELSDALEGPYGRLRDDVAAARVKYVDETGWKRRGVDHWLFAAAGKDAAVFRIDKARTRSSLKKLLRGKLGGVFCSDRAGIYDLIPLSRRGLCWAHLRRDFQRCVDRGGPGEAVGRAGLDACRGVFGLWRDFRERKITRAELRTKVEPLRRTLRRALERGAALGIRKTSGLCRGLLKREAALWNWASVPGLEPTNNLAERMLRPAVIWRKKSFGSDSLGGCVFVERMLSVIQTLRLRKQNMLEYLTAALQHHRAGTPVPAIGPSG